jgi:uncharacterized membrane protein
VGSTDACSIVFEVDVAFVVVRAERTRLSVAFDFDLTLILILIPLDARLRS